MQSYYWPAIHNNPDWPRFAATRPRLQRRQGYEKSRRHINHAHEIRPFAHDSNQSIDHDNTRVVTRTSVEKPHTYDKSMNETRTLQAFTQSMNRITLIDWRRVFPIFPWLYHRWLRITQKTYFYSPTLLHDIPTGMIYLPDIRNLLCWCCEW